MQSLIPGAVVGGCQSLWRLAAVVELQSGFRCTRKTDRNHEYAHFPTGGDLTRKSDIAPLWLSGLPATSNDERLVVNHKTNWTDT